MPPFCIYRYRSGPIPAGRIPIEYPELALRVWDNRRFSMTSDLRRCGRASTSSSPPENVRAAMRNFVPQCNHDWTQAMGRSVGGLLSAVVTDGRLLESLFFRIQSRFRRSSEELVVRRPFQAVSCLASPTSLSNLLSLPPSKLEPSSVRGRLVPFGVSYGNIDYPY